MMMALTAVFVEAALPLLLLLFAAAAVAAVVLLLRCLKLRRRADFFENEVSGAFIVLERSGNESFSVKKVNVGFLRIIGKNSFSAGSDFLSCVHGDDRIRVLTALLRAEDGNRSELQFRLAEDGIWLLARLLADNGLVYCHCSDITALKKTEEELRLSREEFSVATRSMADIFLVVDYATRIISTKNFRRANAVFGSKDLPVDKLLALPLFSDTDRESLKSLFNSVNAGAESAVCDITLCSGEKARYYRISATNIYDNYSLPARAVVTVQNVTAEKESALRAESERHSRETLMHQSVAFYVLRITSDRLLPSGEESEIPYSISDADSFIGRYIHPDDRAAFSNWLKENLSAMTACHGESYSSIDYRRKSGDRYMWCSCTLNFYDDNGESCALATVRDINERKLAEQALLFRSERDSLTGILNRSSIIGYAERCLESPDSRLSALFCLDVDNFKSVNDLCGHSEGDRVLAELAGLLSESVLSIGETGRIGGDEFLCFIPAVSSKKEAVTLAETLLAAARKITVCDGRHISLSIGISFAPSDDTRFYGLYNKADSALYVAKNSGKNRLALYSPEKKD